MQAIERNIKTAIVDKTPSVSSAALVSSYHLLPIARDIVKRWQSETQEAASSSKSSGGFSLGFGGGGHHLADRAGGFGRHRRGDQQKQGEEDAAHRAIAAAATGASFAFWICSSMAAC